MDCTSQSEKAELLESILLTVGERSDVPTQPIDDIVSSAHRCRTLYVKLGKKEELLAAQAPKQEILQKVKAEKESELASAKEKVEAKDADIKLLESQKKKLEEELSSVVADLRKQTKVATDLQQEAINKIPKDNFIVGLLKNITNIEWDVKSCQKSTSVRGAIVAKSGIKTFDFDSASQSDRDIQESLWAMMKEADSFKAAMDQFVQ